MNQFLRFAYVIAWRSYFLLILVELFFLGNKTCSGMVFHSKPHTYSVIPKSLSENDLVKQINQLYLEKPEFIFEKYNLYFQKYYSHKNWDSLAVLNYAMGKCLYLNNKPDQSLIYLKKNLNPPFLQGKLISVLDESKFIIAQNYCDKYQPDSALFYLRQVLKFREEHYGIDTLTAKASAQMAEIFKKNFINKTGAQKYLLKAVKILEQITPTPSNLLIDSYFGLMEAYYLYGNHDLSETYGKSALELIYQYGLTKTPLHEKVLWRMGWIYNNLGDYENAIRYLNKSYEMIGLVVKKQEENTERALRLKAIGIAYLGLKKYNEANEVFEEALRYTLLSESEISSHAAVCYYYFGLTHLERYEFGDNKDPTLLNKSIEKFQRSEQIFHQLEGIGFDIRSRSRNYRRLARAYYFLEERDSAMKYVQKSIFVNKPFSNHFENPGISHFLKNYSYFIALRQKCDFYREWYLQNPADKGLSESILSNFLTIDSLVNFHRNDLLIEEAHLYLNQINLKYYEGALEVLFYKWQNNGTHEYLKNLVFRFMENSKASILLKSLKQSELYESVGVPDSLLEQMSAIKGRLAYLRNKELKDDDGNETTIRAEMLGATNELQKLTTYIKANYLNNRKQENYLEAPLSLSDAKTYSIKNEKIIVEYFYGEEAIYGLSVAGEEVRFVKTPRTKNLDDALDTFKTETIEGIPLDHISRRCDNYERTGYFLYNTLLKDLVDSTRFSKLIIVPDGNLSYLPFETLITEENTSFSFEYNNLYYLLKKFSISYAFSLSAQLKLPLPESIRKPKVLAFSFSDLENTPALFNKKEGSFKELPGAVEELKSISNVFTGSYFYGSQASESAFKESAGNYNLLHLALHNVNDFKNPLNSKIIFRADKDSLNDGELYVHELYKVNMGAKLVVLSACESGVGKWNKGEGVYSLGRSLSNLGCSSIVMSLWKVDDRSTSQIMSNFYCNLSDGQSVDDALRHAKLKFLESADNLMAHPSNWAGFIFSGEGISVVKTYGIRYQLIGGFLFLGLIFLFIVKFRKQILK